MSELYRVRREQNSVNSQIGAFRILANAVVLADAKTGYSVFDGGGNLTYKPLFRVRKRWTDTDSQIGEYESYTEAVEAADAHSGYRVYDFLGVPRYPLPYQVQTTSDLPLYANGYGIVQTGTAKAGEYTITDLKSPFGKLEDGTGWINLTGLDVYTVDLSPLELAAANVADVYDACLGCKHTTTTYSWAEAMQKKAVNCAVPVSRVATLAGLIADGAQISHTTAVSTGVLAKKNTIAKALSGYDNLDLTKCKVVWVGKKYADLDDQYKKAGVIYVQDSNIAVCAGDGDIYACHNWTKQMTDGVYTKVKLSSGYTKTGYILVAIVPND